ncbi:E3 ubiquitin-protein ligase RAD18-like [Actinia tenebrosa]|uniref:RING-type E3 ubiquitin transferase n=1 Tax=Actinia tenebrosa TaxID=6105 RepID=A0A6P8HBV1_ACTTE|nr:E3 ubiquitin-protein ligase RAD18-like [Actinia tenebrosa]
MAPTHQADWSPSDWPESLQELRRIDNLLRCSICYEYFDTAVLFQECSHNYCSLCIRRAMVYDPQCPTCFEKTSGNDLKCNRVLDELVKNFVNVRPKLLDIIRKALVQSVPEKKENIEMSDDSASNFEITPRRMRMNLKTKTKKGKSPHLTPRTKRKRQKLLSSDSDDNDNEDVKKPQAMEIDPMKSPTNTSQSTDDAEAPTSFVECPVCGEMISSNTVNSHLDLCLISGEKKSSLRSRKKATDTKLKQEPVAASLSRKSPVRLASSSTEKKVTEKIAGANKFIPAGPKRKPIPGIVYAILSEKQLKQKLKEWKLSTQGDRKTLIKRHQDFVVAYNAQCDSVNPKPVSAIVKELENKEKRNTKLLKATSTVPNLNRDATEEQVEKVHKQYLQENKGQFEKLIDEIKERKQTGNTLDDKSSTESVVIIDDEDSKSSSSFGIFQQIDTENKSENKNAQQLHSKDQRNKNCSKSSPEGNLRKEEISAAFQLSENNQKRVPEPPLMSNLASINESDSDNEDTDGAEDVTVHEGNGDDGDETEDDEGNGEDGDETDDDKDDTDDEGNDSDGTNEDKSDEDWQLTPAFGKASSDEEYNEEENGESDEDLFATTPRRWTKTRSLRRKKK